MGRLGGADVLLSLWVSGFWMFSLPGAWTFRGASAELIPQTYSPLPLARSSFSELRSRNLVNFLEGKSNKKTKGTAL